MTHIADLVEWLGWPGLLATTLLLGIAYVVTLWALIFEVYSWTRPRRK